MDVRLMQCLLFLVALFFYSGSMISASDGGNCSLSSPAAHQTEKHLAHEHKPKTKRTLYTETELETTQMDVVTPVTTMPLTNPTTPTSTYPTYNPTTPASTLPPYNPDPTTSPTLMPPTTTTPTTGPYTTPTIGPPTTTTPTTGPYTTPTIGPPTTGPDTTPTTGPYTTPTSGTPSSSGTWCVASPSASQPALQVALDYACGFGGADCSGIQSGGSCFNPDTLRDHASYAFNDYYQKNPVSTSCDFAGTAVLTNTDPSTTTCQFPSSGSSSGAGLGSGSGSGSSTLNTTNPTGSTTFGGGGSLPPDTSGAASTMIPMSLFLLLAFLLQSLHYLMVYK